MICISIVDSGGRKKKKNSIALKETESWSWNCYHSWPEKKVCDLFIVLPA